MALYDLVHYKHRLLQAFDTEPVLTELARLRYQLQNINSQRPDNQSFMESLLQQYDQLSDFVRNTEFQTQTQIKLIDQEIHEITQRLFAGNYELEERTGGFNNVRNGRRISVNQDVENIIKQRILIFTNWRYPALEIGCRDGEWTQYMVAADPLYITDSFTEFLESASSRFPEAYQRRLRRYPLTNHDLSALPASQMSFVFSWGYFNYVSLDTMKQYLRQIYALLRPGGTFMFSYNDGDTPNGAGMAENFAQTYMPKSLLIPLCESLGFNVTADSNFETVAWLEISKPGQLSTVKAHQVLGEIKRITV